jgi:ADP-ribose pyrophosphatase YjhB (NUDIX family)
MALATGLLARGPWDPAQVKTAWLSEEYRPPAADAAAADAAITALRDRGSPSHDGLSARLAGFSASPDRLDLELQPARWSLRLVEGNASASLSALCVTRAADGRWLAGRRAPWLASWAGRWAHGAGGSVEVGECPTDTLVRELREEWSVTPERFTVEALLNLPHHMAMIVGLAWLPDGAEVVPDVEHDAFAWWPADVDQWPEEADGPLRRVAQMLSA